MKGVSLFADDNSQVNTPAGIQPSAAGGRVNEMNLQYYVFPIMILLIFLLISLLGSSSFTHEVKLQIANQQRTMEGMLNGKNNNIEKVVIVQNDELGELSSLINKYIDKFNVVLETIFKNTGQVKNVSNNLDNSLDDASSAIHEMVVSVKQISTSTNHQITIVEKIRGSVEEMLIGLEGAFSDITSLSSFVQETSSAMGETTASIKTISDNTDKINKLEESLVRISKAGNVSVNNNIQAIRDIEKASKLIVEIVGMISDIASQTDLLAINAAIESAHAGNKGKGFAVVADEIRKLAEKSKQNASQIIEYIKDMNNKVQKGVQLAVESGNAFNKIDEEINLSNKLISEVSQALQEQSRGTGEILNSISEMLKSTIELKEIADDMQSKSENIHKHMEDLFNISTEINNATDEQDKSNRNISVMITNVKDVSTKNISLLNDLNSAITNFDTLKISN